MRDVRSALSVHGLLALTCSMLLGTSVHAQSWTQIAPAARPEPRSGALLVYDPARRQMLLFGGHALDESDETWTLDADVWTERTPARAPQARRDAYGFWDGARDRVLMFGGNAAGQVDRSVLWSWDGSAWSSFAPAQNPPARRDAAVAYDSVRDRVVLFGGVVDGSPDVTLADTWEFDGSTWIETTPATSPGDRGGALMGYDPLRKLAVLVSGYSESARSLRYDTWSYDGSTWTELTNAGTPSGTSLEMVWDPVQQKLLMAGRSETGRLTSWYFDGATWSEHSVSTYALNGGFEASLAFDSDRGYALYLRQENQAYLGFRLRGTVWDQLLPVAQPRGSEVGHAALTFDTAAGELRLINDNPGGTPEAFRWDGVMWRALELTGQPPSSVGVMAYDTHRHVPVVHDGSTFELAGATWTRKSTSVAPPAAGGITYDSERGRLVYFGGVVAFAQFAEGTWTWDGARWEQLAVLGSPGARRGPALGYDERRSRGVLFGGLVNLNGQVQHAFDTWELSGTTWSRSVAQGPTGLRDHASLTYDVGRGRVVMWAEQDADEGRLWEYTGTAWIGTEPPPIEGMNGILGYDRREQRLLLHDEQGRTWARASGSLAPLDADAGPSSDAAVEGTPGSTRDAGVLGSDGGGTGQGDTADATSTDGTDEGRDRRGESGCALTSGARTSAASTLALIATLCLLHRRARRRGRASPG